MAISSTPSKVWDRRYLRVAKHVASWSKDPSTQCGAVLVRPNRTLASVGFNGFPKGMSDDPTLYGDRDKKYPRIIHSEWNAIRACKDSSLQDYTVYAWPMPPCDLCTAPLVQKGVSRSVCPHPSAEKLERWRIPFDFAVGTWKAKNADITYMDMDAPLLGFPEVPAGTPKWQKRFLALAQEVASWSRDPIDPRAAIIVRPDKTLCSLGFNGFPQGVDDTPLIEGQLDVRKSRMLEAELNAILFSQDPSMEGHLVYTWPSLPDLRAAVHLIAEGVKCIVAPAIPNQSVVRADALAAFAEAGVEVITVDLVIPEMESKRSPGFKP